MMTGVTCEAGSDRKLHRNLLLQRVGLGASGSCKGAGRAGVELPTLEVDTLGRAPDPPVCTPPALKPFRL